VAQYIIDFHTHAFPDALAPSAMDTLLAKAPGTPAHRDGTVGSLLGSMDEAGIEKSVLCCIATRPEQFDSILRWCGEIRSKRLIPFPSVHPADPERIARLCQIKAEGFRGIKMHPYYQNFHVSDDRMLAFYEEASRLGLVLVTHSGFDMAFPRERRADPESLLRISETFPGLRLVTAHLGGWQQWEEVRRYLLGRPVYMEISFAMQDLVRATAREMLMAHPAEYLLFGSDSPWTDQRETVLRLEELRLPPSRLDRLLRRNAEDLLSQPDGLL
jgi:predicted TIM-barrel fold metal-dependent hydrolase